MLQATDLTKRFGKFTALNSISLTVPDSCIYGLVGSNGAGKSTFLRTVCGIYRADSGTVTFDGLPIYDNPEAKRQFVLVPDDLFFLHGATPERMQQLYASVYPSFDSGRYRELLEQFRLPAQKPVAQFSKGMRRLTATALALASKPKLVLFDETMDGLDPIMRHIVKSIIADDVTSRGASAVVVSHSLRELEDLCDQLALLHQGGIVLERDIGNLKTSAFKIQIAFAEPFEREHFAMLDIVHYQQQGKVATLIVTGDRNETEATLRAMEPLLLEVLPLSLEEVFTYELQARNYDFATLIGGDEG
ncbi:MAG: ABC transporter ATP-binding protein [Ruminococcaceae bacterium]|nr:ABC transporter ATP-binding protein [Oscillospiraceae bacterium]